MTTLVSPAGIQLARFPRQHLVLQPKLSAIRVRLGLENGLSTRIVPEPGNWKRIQLLTLQNTSGGGDFSLQAERQPVAICAFALITP